MSKRLGMSYEYYKECEEGAKPFSTNKIFKLCDIFEVKEKELLGEEQYSIFSKSFAKGRKHIIIAAIYMLIEGLLVERIVIDLQHTEPLALGIALFLFALPILGLYFGFTFTFLHDAKRRPYFKSMGYVGVGMITVMKLWLLIAVLGLFL